VITTIVTIHYILQDGAILGSASFRQVPEDPIFQRPVKSFHDSGLGVGVLSGKEMYIFTFQKFLHVFIQEFSAFIAL
jgi:hypothetical protein